jgi:uracil-DNA glycosylase
MPDKIEDLVSKMIICRSCHMRAGCTQVVPPVGQFDRPILMIVGEAPGQPEDDRGEPFVGEAGQILREVLRGTKIINRKNTVITNVLKCRPPKNKFPTDACPSICFGNWLSKEIEILKPERILLLGGKPLEYVAELDGITRCRGTWMIAKGIRTMATFHPNYILKADRDGMHCHRDTFERDIADVAREVAEIERTRNASQNRHAPTDAGEQNTQCNSEENDSSITL